MFLALFKYIASARSRSMRGVSQPAFMSSCLIISYTCFSCLSSRRVRKFPCVSQGGGGQGGAGGGVAGTVGRDQQVGCGVVYFSVCGGYMDD